MKRTEKICVKGGALMLCMDESDRLGGYSAVSYAGNNDSTDTSRPTRMKQRATEDISENGGIHGPTQVSRQGYKIINEYQTW